MPDPGQSRCVDRYPGDCAGARPSGPSAADLERQRQAREASRQAAWEKKQEKQRAKQAAEAQHQAEQQQRMQEEEARKQAALELQREQAAEAARRQAAFNVLKPALAARLMPADDSTVVDLRGIKEPDLATIPMLRGSTPPAWMSQVTDPQVARHAGHLAAFVPPLPVPQKEVPLTWSKMILNHQEGLVESTDYIAAGWEMIGPAIPLPAKVIFIAGKTFIAGEDGAALYLARKDEDYNAALAYLKDPAQARQFASIVQKLREGKPIPTFTPPGMVEAARAIADPRLNRSGAAIAWDAMISREALSAMIRKASIEAGSELLSDSTKDAIFDEHERKAVFDALRADRSQAVHMFRDPATTAAQREQLKLVIDHANSAMSTIYHVEKVSDAVGGEFIGRATDELATTLLGPEPKAPEEK